MCAAARALLALALPGLLAGCASTDSSAKNYLFIHKSGDLLDERGQAYASADAARERVRRMLDVDDGTIMIYIHGGLNTRSAGASRASDMGAAIEKYNRAYPAEKIHPIFINWNSGLLSSYLEHLLFHRRGESWSFWGPLTSPFVLIEDAGRALARIPRNLIHTFNIYSKTYPFAGTASGSNSYQVSEMAGGDRVFGDLTSQADHRSGWTKGRHALETSLTHTVGLVSNIYMDFFGTGAWDVMKQRTELMFTKGRPKRHAHYQSVDEYTALRRGGLDHLLHELRGPTPQKSGKRKLILVGHSMGTIVANHILAAYPDLKFDRIIYMAAAASIKDFQTFVLPYMARHCETTFYNYMLHPLAENREAPYGGLGGTGSLLVQIDDMYERPVAENQRTLGRWENVMNGLTYFNIKDGASTYMPLMQEEKSIRKRIHLRTLPFSGSVPTSHGAFDDIEFMNGENGYFWEDSYHRSPPEPAPQDHAPVERHDS